MYWISENIFSALKGSNIIIQSLDDSEKEKVWDRINLRYIDSKKKGIFLWEKLKDYVTIWTRVIQKRKNTLYNY